jgi:hypothetical protein
MDWTQNGIQHRIDSTLKVTQSRMDWTQNGIQHRIDSTLKVTQSRMDWTQNGTQHRIDLTPKGTQPAGFKLLQQWAAAPIATLKHLGFFSSTRYGPWYFDSKGEEDCPHRMYTWGTSFREAGTSPLGSAASAGDVHCPWEGPEQCGSGEDPIH